jgi:hypothetical protein
VQLAVDRPVNRFAVVKRIADVGIVCRLGFGARG